MRLIDYVKFGFGFYVGYESAKKVVSIGKELYPLLKDRIKKGYC